MSRQGYDDISDRKVSHRRSSSSRVLLAVILLSVLICAIAVLVWVKILEAQDVRQAAVPAVGNNAGDRFVLAPSGTSASSASASGTASGSSETSGSSSSATTTVASAELPSSEPSGQDNAGLNTVASRSDASRVPEVSTSIDDGLSKVPSASGETESENFLHGNFNGFGNADDAEVTDEGIAMKKPIIAQNLSISQQSSFSKNIVRYTEYSIENGDTLVSIAESFGLDPRTIISVNQIRNSSSLYVGRTLQIPDRDGTLYYVKEGDTLLSITQQYGLGLSAKTLGDINGILDDSLQAGQALFIPSENIETSGTVTVSQNPEFVLPASDATVVGMYNHRVADPVSNELVQLDGILIQSVAGNPVYASENGTVIDKGFNDNGSGFVKILHDGGYTTYYDYLADICVEATDKVEQGDYLGFFSAETTNMESPTVFFRIEQDGLTLDPSSFVI